MPFSQQQRDAINETLDSLNTHVNTILECRDDLTSAMRARIDATLEAADVTDVIASCKAGAKAAADALSALLS